MKNKRFEKVKEKIARKKFVYLCGECGFVWESKNEKVKRCSRDQSTKIDFKI